MAITERISSSLPAAVLGRRHFDVWNLQSATDEPLRLAILDCSCEGVCPSIPSGSLPNGVASPTCDALCLNTHEQDALADLVSQHSITDLIITGCDAEPIPSELKRSLSSIGCSTKGLGWLDETRTESIHWRMKSITYSTQDTTESTLD